MKVNKYGCKVSGDVCLKHCEPLWCKHGCRYQLKDSCKCVTYEYEKIGDLKRWEEDDLNPQWATKTQRQIIDDLIDTIRNSREELQTHIEPEHILDKTYDEYIKSGDKNITFVDYLSKKWHLDF